MTRETWAQKDRTRKEELLRFCMPNMAAVDASRWADTSWDFLPDAVKSWIELWERSVTAKTGANPPRAEIGEKTPRN